MLGLVLGDPAERAGDLRSGLGSSSFRMRDVMSNPRNGFWSGSLVGEVSRDLTPPPPPPPLGSLSTGLAGGLTAAGLSPSSGKIEWSH